MPRVFSPLAHLASGYLRWKVPLRGVARGRASGGCPGRAFWGAAWELGAFLLLLGLPVASYRVGGAGGAVLKPKEPPERAWEACRLKIVRGHETDLGLSKLLVFEAGTATRAPSPNTAAAGDISQ